MLTTVHLPPDPETALRTIEGGAVPLAGGTHVMPRLNTHAGEESELVSLRKAGLGGLEVDGDEVSIGAMTTLATLERDPRIPYLHDVTRAIASPPVRSLATIGGNLFVPQPYGDLSVALVALGATLDVLTSDGSQRLDMTDLLAHGLPDKALVTRVRFRRPDEHTAVFRFHKASRRRFNSGSIGTIAAWMVLRDGVVEDARIALGGLAETVVRASSAERALLGAPLDHEHVTAAAESAVTGDIEPFDDAYASAWYRARVLPVHFRRALLAD